MRETAQGSGLAANAFAGSVVVGCPAVACGRDRVILGTVSDATGAAVPSAKVVLRNANTGLMRPTQADPSGNYEFLVVPVGEDYAVEVILGGSRDLLNMVSIFKS